MLFNSYEFLLIFLPLVAVLYFVLNRYVSFTAGKVFLLLSSLFFYSYWNPIYILLLLFTIGFNFIVGRALADNRSKVLLIFGIVVNLGLLLYYKYSNFFINNINASLGTEWHIGNIILPLGISFITFQKNRFPCRLLQGPGQRKQPAQLFFIRLFLSTTYSGPDSTPQRDVAPV